MTTETPVLTNKDEYPDVIVIERALKGRFVIYDELVNSLTTEPYNLMYDWKFYKDGSAWLCKFHQKKTVFWLSIWDGFFKVTFYFSAKHCEEIEDLKIDQRIKSAYKDAPFTGKLKPLTIDVSDKNLIKDILRIVEYKMKN